MCRNINWFYPFVLLALLLLNVPLPAQKISNADSIEQVIRAAPTDSQKVITLISLTRSVQCIDTAEKLKYANEALAISRNAKWNKGLVLAEINLGDIYNFCYQDNSQAIHYFQLALDLARTNHDTLNQARALASMANNYGVLSQYGAAINFNREALDIHPGNEAAVGILGNMGILYTRVGDYANALACYDSSLKLLDLVPHTNKAEAENNNLQRGGLLVTIGDIYLKMSQAEKALVNYNSALDLFEKSGRKYLAIHALIGIGNAYHLANDYSRAIENFNRALALRKECNCRQEEVTILNELGSVYADVGDLNRAMEYALQALKLVEDNEFYDLQPVVFTSLGRIYTHQHNYAVAVGYLKKALAICGRNCSLTGQEAAWEVLSNTYDQMHEPALALDAYRHFIAARDSVYNIAKANELTRIDLQSEYDRQHISDSLKQSMVYRLRIERQQVFTYSGYAGLAVVLLLSLFIYRNYSQQKKANHIISRANEATIQEKQVSENLLLNILPEDVARELKSRGQVEARLFDHVTVLFTDFVNFTEAGERFTPQELVAELHTCFMAFDMIVSKYNIEKIKTVGDAYMAVAGLPNADPDHAVNVVLAAIEIRDFIAKRREIYGNHTFDIRIGANSGTVVAGIVGVKKFAYDIWGDTVNIAARIEQYSEPGMINISQNTYELVKGRFKCTDRGEVDAKHKGRMRMYFVEHALT